MSSNTNNNGGTQPPFEIDPDEEGVATQIATQQNSYMYQVHPRPGRGGIQSATSWHDQPRRHTTVRPSQANTTPASTAGTTSQSQAGQPATHASATGSNTGTTAGTDTSTTGGSSTGTANRVDH